MTAIAKNIQTALEQSELSQAELAQRAGISKSHISYILRGKREPTVKMMKKISSALNCPLAELLEDGSAPAEKKRRAV